MNIFDQLADGANSVEELDGLLSENIQALLELQQANYSEVFKVKNSFENFIHFKVHLVSALDFTKGYNKAFVVILFDFCERFGTEIAVRIYKIITKNQLQTGKRLEAAAQFLIHIRSNEHFIERFESICTLLQAALEEEEDDERNVTFTFLKYLSRAVIDTPAETAMELVTRIKHELIDDRFPFLQHPSIQHAVHLDFTDQENAYVQIQRLIEKLYERDITILPRLDSSEVITLIETGTSYSDSIEMAPRKFEHIRTVSVQYHSSFENRDEVYKGLRRGAKVLVNERELFAYMHGLGPMHYAKLMRAFEHLPAVIYEERVNIVDWGCGQGLASMCYLERLRDMDAALKVNSVTLIEPSELALKRAALHVQMMDDMVEIITVRQYLDLVEDEDLPSRGQPTLHLFSNILDIREISLQKLCALVSRAFHGKNYFVCVSPMISHDVTARIESFVDFFRHGAEFHCHLSLVKPKDQWINKWSIVAYVFEVNKV